MLTDMKSKLVQKYDKVLEIFTDFSEFQKDFLNKYNEIQELLEAASQDKAGLSYYKWLNFQYLHEINQKTIAMAKKIKAKKNIKNIFVIGMGGSGINSLVLKNGLYEFSNQKRPYKFLIQNNLDPVSLLARLDEIDESFHQTFFVVITKSGGTDEVRRNLLTILNYAQKKDDFDITQFAENLLFITEPENSQKENFIHKLRAEIKELADFDVPYLENDPNIGGRFSMFSPVGMFSAEMMGLDSEALINGAQRAFENFKSGNQAFFDLATLDIYLARKSFSTRYSMVYADSLEALNKFRAQLKGESLNKDGIDATIHVPGIGTVNHHSDLELLLKKNNGVILEQVFFAVPLRDHQNKASLEAFKDLEGQSNYEALRKNHIEALANYMLENKAPVIQTILEKQDEESIAEFCMQDMLLTVIQAGLQDELGKTEKQDLVIRQWEVERYKKSAKK